MPPKAQGGYAQRIRFHRNRAGSFHRIARRRHLRAAALARQALQAQRNGRPAEARRLMQLALRLKAAAGRAGARSEMHRRRIAALRKARMAAAQPRRAR